MTSSFPGVLDLGDFEITVAETQDGQVVGGLDGLTNATISARLAYGSAGTTIIATVSTSLDQGLTWIPIARFDFAMAGLEKVYNLNAMTSKTSPYTVAALGSEGAIDGILGDRLKAEVISTGTYVNSTVLSIRVLAR